MLTPPVGMKRIDRYGPWNAFNVFTPPIASAGKNFTTSKPNSSACSRSVGLDVPGNTGTLLSTHHFTVRGLNPGATMNWEPASVTAAACSALLTVPAPTRKSLRFDSAAIEGKPASVRSVISAHGMPPSDNASARRSASSTLSIATTGTTLSSSICLAISFIASFVYSIVFL